MDLHRNFLTKVWVSSDTKLLEKAMTSIDSQRNSFRNNEIQAYSGQWGTPEVDLSVWKLCMILLGYAVTCYAYIWQAWEVVP